MQPVHEITERYRTEEVISSEASLTVCSATDAASGARVVVELVNASRGAPGGVAGRFLEAVAALARLRHASLPAVLDGGATEDGVVFLVRESVDGRPFHTLGGESPGQILSLLLQVVGGLELLATEGIYHGGLSLDTLWVAAGPERPRAKILGLAAGVWHFRAAGADPRGGLREDVRALGAIASRLLGATVSDPASEQPAVKLPLAVAFELEDGDALGALLERCLRRDPADRPADYAELRKGLCIALWGEPEGGQAPVTGASGAPPARLTFTTVPDDSLIEPEVPPPPPTAPPPGRPRPKDEGEITKVVLPEELEGFKDDDEGEDTAEVAARAAAEARARKAAEPPRRRPAAGAPPPPQAGSQAPSREPAPPAEEALASAPQLPEPDEMLTPVDFVPTGDETLSEPPQPEPPTSLPPSWPIEPAAEAAPPPLAAAASGAAASARPAPPPATAAPAGPARAARRRTAVIAALAAGVLVVLVLGVVAALWLSGRGGEEQAETVAPPPPLATEPVEPVPEPPPPVPADPRLTAIVERFAAGEDAEAAAALAAIPAEVQAGFTPAECELVGLLGDSIDRAAEAGAAEALRSGFVDGDLARLRRGAEAVAGRERSFVARYPGSADDLARAQRTLAVFERARRGIAAGEPDRVLEQTAVLRELLPTWGGVAALRDAAAEAIEGEVESLLERGRYGEALERIDALAAAMPERDGLDRRRELIRTRQRTERDVDALLAEAERAGTEGRPDEGLELLSGVDAPARLGSELAQLRGRLEERLAELDRGAPEIDVGGGEYPKDETAEIVFQVRDDYRVERVTVRVRVDGNDAWQALPGSRRSGDASSGEYAVEVPPDFHGNETIVYYVTATDLSGHETMAGSAEQPLELKRRRWFHRILPE